VKTEEFLKKYFFLRLCYHLFGSLETAEEIVEKSIIAMC
jgi:hypothetical protein